MPLFLNVRRCERWRIAVCYSADNSDALMAFMLDMINQTLDWVLQQITEKDAYLLGKFKN